MPLYLFVHACKSISFILINFCIFNSELPSKETKCNCNFASSLNIPVFLMTYRLFLLCMCMCNSLFNSFPYWKKDIEGLCQCVLMNKLGLCTYLSKKNIWHLKVKCSFENVNTWCLYKYKWTFGQPVCALRYILCIVNRIKIQGPW